jgi:hypothetical protein
VNPLSEAEAAAVWQVLVDHAGAVDGTYDGEVFVRCQSANAEPEWRIGGLLGFGGKFRRNRVRIGSTRTESWTVTCYREDETPARLAIIEKTNEALAELRKELVEQ